MEMQTTSSHTNTLSLYIQSHAGFYYPWQFVVAFKAFKSRDGWFGSESETNLKIHQRIIRTKNGNSSLRYFDGATMLSYKFPSKASETVFCLRDSKSEMCQESLVLPDISSLDTSILQLLQLEPSEKDGAFDTISVPIQSPTLLDESEGTRETIIRQYFSGENTYNPFAERQPSLHAGASYYN